MHPYSTDAYARSLSHWGEALAVPEWKTSVIIRNIRANCLDATGTYPIAIIDAKADLRGGLDRLRRAGMVSVLVVLDDFHRPPLEKLRECFTVVRPYKTHYIRRLKGALDAQVYPKDHQRSLKRALRTLTVQPFDLKDNLADWQDLYGILAKRHSLSGVHLFPAAYFQALATLDGVVAIGAWWEGVLISCHIWVTDGRYVHSHLAASSDVGYKCRAPHAVNDASLRYFSGCELVNLGGAAGLVDENDSLTYFKRGFANDVSSSYVCGAILDYDRYEHLTRQNGAGENVDFFPAYRTPSMLPVRTELQAG